MAKDILAFFGLIFLTLIIIAAVLGLGLFYDQLGMISLPPGLIETPMSFLTQAPVKIAVTSVGKGEFTNPLDLLPDPSETPEPTITATPEPPLDPAVYRSEAMMELKRFAAALEDWLNANEQLAKDNSLLNNTDWQNSVKATLDEVAASGQALAAVGPAPEEYAGIDALFKKVGPEAVTLQTSYLRAIETGDSKYFRQSGDSFSRIKNSLTEAAKEMLAAGWTAE